MATITQGTDLVGVDGNEADILQVGANNVATVSLFGDNNIVDVDQLAASSTASVTHNGSGNNTTIVQN